ncbi:MAG: hypothetical protein GY747_14215 [Planctomycetes bacterium]|nr:hypothetical protein [Planctomycetota bacterium]
MHLLLLLVLALCACGEVVSKPARSLQGADAKLAFMQCRQGLNLDWGYPVDFRFEFVGEYGSEAPDYEGFHGNAEFTADVSVRAPWLFDLAFGLLIAQEDGNRIEAHAQIACDEGRLRMDFPLVEGIKMDRKRPISVSVSTERLELAFGVVLEQLFKAAKDPDIRKVLNDYFVFEDLSLVQGMGDIFHPRVGLNGLTTAPFVVRGWHEHGEAVTLELGFDFHSMQKMDGEMKRMREKDPDIYETMQRFAEDFTFKATYRLADGYPITAAGEYALDETCAEHGSHPVHFNFKLEYLPLEAPIPSFAFSEPDQQEDLDESFDAYWPMMRASLPEVFRAMARQIESKEAEEDFSF